MSDWTVGDSVASAWDGERDMCRGRGVLDDGVTLWDVEDDVLLTYVVDQWTEMMCCAHDEEDG